jgi:hypothetical protein
MFRLLGVGQQPPVRRISVDAMSELQLREIRATGLEQLLYRLRPQIENAANPRVARVVESSGHPV